MHFFNIRNRYGGVLAISVSVAANAALACAQIPCTPSQLTGGDGIFTVSTGNGTYLQGTAQAILWDQPAGNPIRRISNNITIFSKTVNSIIAQPEDITGAPVVILNRTIAHTGGIGVTIPESLPDGDDYVYRVIVRGRRGHCYLDTNTFSVRRTVTQPQENCRPGSMKCVDENSAFTQCVETDDTDTVFDFGLPIDCAATTTCIQITDFTIGCSPGGSNPGECVLGTVDCVDETHSRICIEGPNGTPIWGPPEECAAGFECNEENGQCEPGPPSTTTSTSSATATATLPPDECILGTQECVTDASNRVCLIGDAGNNVWGPETLCPAGTTCIDGLCTSGGGNPGTGSSSVIATDTVTETATEPTSISTTYTTTIITTPTVTPTGGTTGGTQTASASDSSTSSIPDIETVTGSTTVITVTDTTSIVTSTSASATATATLLPDECVLDSAECITETSNRVCVIGPDGNAIWGPETECLAGTTCEDGFCTSGNPPGPGTGTTASETATATATGISTFLPTTTDGPATLSTIVITDTETATASSDVPTITITGTPTETTTTATDTSTATGTPLPDECVVGERECVTDLISRECVLNSDGHAVWQNADCSPGTTCADGICSSGVPGQTACFPRMQICLTDTTYDECSQSDEGFWKFGGVTLTCGPGRVCVPYFNDTINCIIPEPVVNRRRRRNRYSFF